MKHDMLPHRCAMEDAARPSTRACPRWAGALFALVSSCVPHPDDGPQESDVLAHLPRHEEQLRRLCARGSADAVAQAFCREPGGPSVRSLVDVQDLLGLSFDGDVPPAFSLVGHSSALPSRSVSAINPGSVIVSLPEGDPPDGSPINGAPGPRRRDGNILSVAYARGDQFVEFAVMPPSGLLRLYLLRYEQPCNDTPEGCTPADLLTEATERDWTSWSLYDDADLANTVLDCLHCHEPDGPGTTRIFRLQEVENPWTHWMATFTLGGRALLDDTLAAHGTEGTIAGIPGRLVTRTDPVVMEDLIRFAGSVQPDVFPAPEIERQVMASSPGQPADNSVPGTSAAWQEVYARAVRGEAIPPPYHDVKVTDPDKLAAATRAWVAYREGDMTDLPDIRDVFSDDALAGMSHRPQAGLDGRGILVHACAQCHNPRLDQSLSRAGFDALRIDEMSDAARARAIERMLLPRGHRHHMPPSIVRELSPDEVRAAVAALRAAGAR